MLCAFEETLTDPRIKALELEKSFANSLLLAKHTSIHQRNVWQSPYR